MSLFSPAAPRIAPEILFVCTGNICRSAYAEKALALALSEGGNRWGVTSASAGTHGLTGEGMDPVTESLAARRGVDTRHTARRLSEEIVEEGGVVLAMTREHRDFVLARVPRATRRVYTLAEFSRCLELLGNAPAEPAPEDLGELVRRVAAVRSRVALTEEDDVVDPHRREAAVHEAALDRIDALLGPLAAALGDSAPPA
jgi:protein-tyrosine phosphatase